MKISLSSSSRFLKNYFSREKMKDLKYLTLSVSNEQVWSFNGQQELGIFSIISLIEAESNFNLKPHQFSCLIKYNLRVRKNLNALEISTCHQLIYESHMVKSFINEFLYSRLWKSIELKLKLYLTKSTYFISLDSAKNLYYIFLSVGSVKIRLHINQFTQLIVSVDSFGEFNKRFK